jgi:hypothetical protein
MPKAWFLNRTLAERPFQRSIQTTSSSSGLSRFLYRAQPLSTRKLPLRKMSARTIQRRRPSFTSCRRQLAGWTWDRRARMNTAWQRLGIGWQIQRQSRRWAQFALAISALAASRAAKVPFRSRAPHWSTSTVAPPACRPASTGDSAPHKQKPRHLRRGPVWEERCDCSRQKPSDQAGMRSSISCGSRST